MGSGATERRPARPAIAGRRPRAPMACMLALLALGTGGPGAMRDARGEGPEAGRATGARDADLPPLPGSSEARPALPAVGGWEWPEEAEDEEPSPVLGHGPGPKIPGITRFHDLRGLGGSFYRLYGPRTLSRALGLRPAARVQVYGWIQNSFTGNPSRPADGLNFGVNPNSLANRWMGNQYYLVVEDKVEEDDTVNLGWRVDNLVGNDWQFNHMHGLFDTSFVPGHFAGYDPAQLYGEIHLPILTPGGLDVRGGRWYSIVGFESVPAVTRPMLSSPYMFNYGQPFTHFGALSTLHLSDRLKVYNGTVNGWDRWIDARYKWGYIGGFIWAAPGGRTSVSAAMVWGPNQFPNFLPANTEVVPTGATPPPFLAGRRNPGYGSNDRTLFAAVFAQWWSDRLLEVIEADAGFEREVPGLGPGGTSRNASWYGLGHWLMRSIIQEGDYRILSGVWRAEAFRDNDGARTGYADTFYETTLGLIYRPRTWLWIRSEARYDWAGRTHPYNGGHSGSQFTIAVDSLVLF